MIGCFVLGGLFAFAAAKALRRHHRYGGWGHHGMYGGHCGGRWRPGRWEGHFGGDDGDPSGDPHGDQGPWGSPGSGRSGGRGMPVYLRFLSHRLDATPGQERALAEAADLFRADVEPLRAEARKSRADLAAALRKPAFDEVMMGELFARHDDAIEKARRAVVGLGTRVHDALDERQRDLLAAMIERGPRFPGFRNAW